jgi:hypothetical protein
MMTEIIALPESGGKAAKFSFLGARARPYFSAASAKEATLSSANLSLKVRNKRPFSTAF